jgi:hypothetical protein
LKGQFIDDQEEVVMNKLSFFAAALVTIWAASGAPVLAEQAADSANKVSAQRVVCAPHSMGNPYSRKTDYWDWSSWQAHGGWDSRNDFKCTPSQTSR